MFCPNCKAKRFEDISFIQTDAYYCRRCKTVTTMKVKVLTEEQAKAVEKWIKKHNYFKSDEI